MSKQWSSQQPAMYVCVRTCTHCCSQNAIDLCSAYIHVPYHLNFQYFCYDTPCIRQALIGWLDSNLCERVMQKTSADERS